MALIRASGAECEGLTLKNNLAGARKIRARLW
jgi:hypothetical protein